MASKQRTKLDNVDKLHSKLNNWNTLNDGLMKLSESELRTLLLAELMGKRREHILQRLFQRHARVVALQQWGLIDETRKIEDFQKRRDSVAKVSKLLRFNEVVD